MKRVAMLLLAGCVTLAGCGDNDKTGAGTAPADEARTSRANGPGISKGEAKRAAKAALLRLTDFPSGWRDTGSSGDEGSAGECPVADEAKRAALASASSSDFSDKGAQGASSMTYVYETKSQADHWFNVLASRAVRACVSKAFSQGIARGLNEGGKLGDVTASKVAAPRLATPPRRPASR